MPIDSADVRGWPGLWICGERLKLGLVPKLGGRLLSLQHDGEELLFAQDGLRAFPDLSLHTVKGPALGELKKGLGFPLWGGNKLWVAPEMSWLEGTPPLDLDSGCYEAVVEERAVTMTSPICRETGVRLTRKIELGVDDHVILAQRLENCGDTDVVWGMWDVTQWLRPFDVYVATQRDRVRAYAHGNSSSLFDEVVQQTNSWTQIACQTPDEFKFGGIAERGRIIAVRATQAGALVVDIEFPNNPTGTYAHFSSFEVYNASTHPYLEIEMHRQQETLSPGQFVEFRTQWHISRVGGPFNPDALPSLTDD